MAESNIRITAVRTVVVNAQMRNWVFVKVETNQAGLYGWGEASLEWKTRAVAGAVDDFAPMIVDEDPTRIEHLSMNLGQAVAVCLYELVRGESAPTAAETPKPATAASP